MESWGGSNEYAVSIGPETPAWSPPRRAGYPTETSDPTGQPPPRRERAHLLYSILTTLLCCLPIGLGALVYSRKTIAANQQGDFLKARRASDRALTLNRVALTIGAVIYLAGTSYLIFGILAKWDAYKDPRTYKFYLG
ncbi:synapse differentiation-inducing gene protein 1-like [Lissotriton helveticus]